MIAPTSIQWSIRSCSKTTPIIKILDLLLNLAESDYLVLIMTPNGDHLFYDTHTTRLEKNILVGEYCRIFK